MKFHRRKSPGLTRLDKLMTHLSPPLLILPVICAVSLVTTARATTVLEPMPEPSTTLFGFAVSPLGDVNGDSVPDYAVGAPFQDGDFVSTAMGFGLPQNVGKVFVINGATFAVLNVMNDPEFEVIQDQHFGGQLGWAVSVSADLNGDGVADVIAGVPHHIANPSDQDAKTINAGKVLVFSGKTGALLFTINDPEEQEDGRFGTAVAALGDINSDGVADFVVGVPGHDEGDEEDGVANVGIAYVFSGKTGALLATLDDPSETAGAAFGSAVANAGDVNSDHVSDIIVGAPGEAKVHVFNGKTGALLYSIASPKTELLTSFGAVVAGGQDFNRDKKPDIVVGAPLQAGNRGAVYIFDGKNGVLIRRLKPAADQAFAQFGAAIYASPDITGDKRADIIVGAPGQIVNGILGAGQAFVFDGAKGQLKTTLTSATPQADAGFGSAVTSVQFGGSRVSTPVVGVPYQDTVTGSGQTAITHLQAGQIEISQ